MKKLILFFAVVIVLQIGYVNNAAALDSFSIGGGVMTPGVLIISGNSNDTVYIKNGINFGMYYHSELGPRFEMGMGVEVQVSGDSSTTGLLNNAPLFFALNYYPYNIEKMPYITGKLGYSLLQYSDEMYPCNPAFCPYFGVGAGLRFTKFPTIRTEAFLVYNNFSAYSEAIGWDTERTTFGQASCLRAVFTASIGIP